MRRSCAPSRKNKFITPFLKTVTTPSERSSGTSLDKTRVYAGPTINDATSNTLNNTIATRPADSNHLPQDEISQTRDSQEINNRKLFSVVYGKPSKKKHKTWDGDGTLEIGLKSVTLKGSDGKTLGTSSKVKVADLSEGSRIYVGGKEVEIIDVFVEEITNTYKRYRGGECDERDEIDLRDSLLKKRRKSVSVTVKPSSLSTRTWAKPHAEQDPLVMPQPDDQHQWECNVNHDPTTVVTVDSFLNKHLRNHQREGVKFLYRCVTGIRSLKYTGAILADEMGLGKTLQTITLIWTLLRQGPYGGKPLLKRALIVVPSSLVQNWYNEFIRWIGSHRIRIFMVDKKNKAKEFPHSNCPLMIISYDQLVRNVNEIRGVEFDLIVCDEGHRLKNSSIQATNFLSSLPCRQRIILTGTPIQNDLQEYYTLVDFVNPGIFGTPPEFRRNYANAITASRDPKASEQILKEGKEKADELNRITSGFILRRAQAIIGSFLPRKNEYVLFCAPSVLQKSMYTSVSRSWLQRMEDNVIDHTDINHLSAVTLLKKICNHPVLAQSNTIEDRIDVFCKVIDEELDSYCFRASDSGKFSLVMSLMKNLENSKEKIVLVSNFTQTLDLFANIFDKYKYKYLRFDGSTALGKRTEIVDTFNKEYSDVFVLLLSSKAGGVGLNLIGGTRLILYDSDWNPAVDLQAMARIWREGQKRNVFIYRLLTTGTIEEKIFQRQLTKAGLSETIIDPNCKSSVKLPKEEIMELFDFDHNNVKCLTHETLKCNCSCDGSIPENNNLDNLEEVEERDCQLSLSNASYTTPSLRMNQLFQWEHHGPPMSAHILQEIKMENTSAEINFIFRNQS